MDTNEIKEKILERELRRLFFIEKKCPGCLSPWAFLREQKNNSSVYLMCVGCGAEFSIGPGNFIEII